MKHVYETESDNSPFKQSQTLKQKMSKEAHCMNDLASSTQTDFRKAKNVTRPSTADHSKQRNVYWSSKPEEPRLSPTVPHCHNVKTYYPDHPCSRKIKDLDSDPLKRGIEYQRIQTNFHKMVDKTAAIEAKFDRTTAEFRKTKEENEVLRYKLLQSEERNYEAQKEILKLKEELSEMKSKLDQNVSEQMKEKLEQKNSAFLELENDHLRRDNLKLFELLKTSKEFQSFAAFTDSDNRLRSVHSDIPVHTRPSKTVKENKDIARASLTFTKGWKNDTKVARSAHCRKRLWNNNLDMFCWAPEKLFTFLRELNKRESVNIPEAVIDYIVLEINRIWRTRELYIVDHCSAFCKNCKTGIFGLKDKLLKIAVSDEEKIKEIRRLEDKLTVARTRLSSAQKIIERRQNGLFQVSANNVLAFNLKNIRASDF